MIINLGSKYRKHKEESQATATRPLAIQKDGTWFTYGYDITKNVCEVFGPAGYIRTAYSYAPFGNVYASGDVSQPFQWSSEHYDSELDLVYYNFRHYSPSLGRFLSRDPIAEQGGRNLYAFVKNNPILLTDEKGNIVPVFVLGVAISPLIFKCISGFVTSALLALGMQLARCVVKYPTFECQQKCCKVNHCSYLISGIVGCMFSPIPIGFGGLGVEVIKKLLMKFGGGFIVKQLAKLGC